MKEALLLDERVLLRRTTTNHISCNHNGRMTEYQQHAVAIKDPTSARYTFWLSLGGVNAFIDELKAFSPDDAEQSEEFGPLNQYVYCDRSVHTPMIPCIVCQNYHESEPRQKIQLRNAYSEPQWLHVSCISVLCDALDTLWEKAPSLLAEQL